jgi:geranylgeranyl diphosphate synthase, type I
MTVTPLSATGTASVGSPYAPAEPSPSPAGLVAIAARTDRTLNHLIDCERQRWALIDTQLDRPLAALADAVVSGGKRLRPAFCHWGLVAAGVDPDHPPHAERLDAASAALELLHGFALVHDDIMDEADTRRGEPTQHVRFGEEHRRGGWRGAPSRFGESVAILVGDLAHVLADDLVTGMPPRVRSIWRELQTELMMGQFLDVRLTASNHVTLDRALHIARLKSGRYTIRRPLELGAALAGTEDPALDHALGTYGEALGLAFQLRDDLLGAFGDPAVTGKPVGSDLREGKPTPLLAIALERAGAAQRAVLARAGEADLDDREVAAIQQVMVDTGALEESEQTVRRLMDEGLDAIGGGVVPAAAAAALEELAHFVVERDH